MEENEGIKRLEQQVLEMNNINVQNIFEYLKKRNDLQDKFNNEEKSISQMYRYISKNAEKQAVNHVAMIDGNIVYLWAVRYFSQTNEQLGIEKEKEKENTVNKPEIEEKTIKEEKKEDKPKDKQINLFQEVQG